MQLLRGLRACFDFPSRRRSCWFQVSGARRRNGASNQDARRERHRTSGQSGCPSSDVTVTGRPTRVLVHRPVRPSLPCISQSCGNSRPRRALPGPQAARVAMRAFRRLRLQKAVQSISFSFHNFASTESSAMSGYYSFPSFGALSSNSNGPRWQLRHRHVEQPVRPFQRVWMPVDGSARLIGVYQPQLLWGQPASKLPRGGTTLATIEAAKASRAKHRHGGPNGSVYNLK